MYYQSSLHQIEDTLLHAVYFATHKIGGELTRESAHASFRLWRLAPWGAIHSLTELCTLPRPPSRDEAEQYQMMAEGQRGLAQTGSPTARQRYLDTARLSAYAAELAGLDARFVPRRMLVAPTGVAVLAIELEAGMYSTPSAHLRVVDLVGATLGAELARPLPEGTGLLSPWAIAPSGDVVLTSRAQQGRPVSVIERSTADLSEQAEWGQGRLWNPSTAVHAGVDHWLVCDDATGLAIHERGTGTQLSVLPCPPGVLTWCSQYAQGAHRLALAGDRGLVTVVDLESGSARRFWPHPDARRDDHVEVALAADGAWLASRISRSEPVVVTRLADGVAWTAGRLADRHVAETVRAGYQSTSYIPGAFAWIDGHLVLADDGEPRVLTPSEPANGDDARVCEEGRAGARVPIRLPRTHSFKTLLKAAGLTQAAERLRPWYTPPVLLHAKPTKPAYWKAPGVRGSLNLGSSRFGGWPDLPDGSAWPLWQGRPMSFLAQIDLAEAHRCQPELALPTAGLLLVFLGCTDETFDADDGFGERYMTNEILGGDPADRGGWQVLFVPPGETLVRQTMSAQTPPQPYQPAPIRFTKGGLALPHEDAIAYNQLDLSDDERQRYDDLIAQLVVQDEYSGQLGGYPNLIQGPGAELACTRASRGEDPFGAFDPESPEGRALLKAASAWRLIVQLTSISEAEFMWGDAGNLSFYAPAEDLAAARFHSSWPYFEN